MSGVVQQKVSSIELLPDVSEPSEESKKKKWFGFLPTFSMPTTARRPTAGSVSDLMGKMAFSRSDIKDPSVISQQPVSNFKENCVEPLSTRRTTYEAGLGAGDLAMLVGGARYDNRARKQPDGGGGGVIAQDERLPDQKKGIAVTEPGRGVSDRVIDAAHQHQQQVADSGAAGDSGNAKPVTSERAVAATRVEHRAPKYDALRTIGQGSFGSVFLARVVGTDELVAIKKVLEDRRYKNREIQVMKQIAKQPHPYVVTLRHYFTSKGTKPDEIFINLVMELIPETAFSIIEGYKKRKELTPISLVKIYMYQLCRAMGHIHGMGICHRDIKPQNLLVDPRRHIMKLCDFGSAKCLIKGEPNVAYICSRYYRAPELVFGSEEYSTAIDIWSSGCVLGEFLIGTPLFPGNSAVDQLTQILKVLGTPDKEQLKAIDPHYKTRNFQQTRPNQLERALRSGCPPDAVTFASRMLDYIPANRYIAIEACTDPFFDDIRNPVTRMPDGSPLAAELFELTKEETVLSPSVKDLLGSYPGSRVSRGKAVGVSSVNDPSSNESMHMSESYLLEVEAETGAGKSEAIMPAEAVSSSAAAAALADDSDANNSGKGKTPR